jgi:hypothetical protein
VAIHRACAECGRPLHEVSDSVLTDREVMTVDAEGNDTTEVVEVLLCTDCATDLLVEAL